MKIQYCSDLHLEFNQNQKYIIGKPLPVCGDILIMAGDIVPLHDEYLNNSFFSFIADNFKQVFWIPGNHEFYHKDLTEFNSSFTLKLRSNLHIVNNIELNYENIRFIFSTLWTSISHHNERIIESRVSDFSCITKNNRRLKAADFNELHTESYKFIENSLVKKIPKTVMVTHHLPSYLCNSELHNNSPINEAFCVDLTSFVGTSHVNFWIYGHSHFNQKPIYIGDTILLTNQLGYVHLNEHVTFKENAYFSI